MTDALSRHIRALQRAHAAGDAAAVAEIQRRIQAVQSGQAAPAPRPAAALSQVGPEASQEPFRRAGGVGALRAGISEAAIKGMLGVKQLIPGVGLSPQDKAVLEEIKLESEQDPEGFTRGAGSLLGNIAATAVPGNAIGRGVQGLRVLQNSAKLAPSAGLLGTAASSAGTEALTAVGEGDTVAEQLASKAKQAATAGVLGAGSQKLLSGAGKLIAQPFKPTVDAHKLIQQGVNPTLQQGAESGWGKFVGGLASGASRVRRRQEAEAENAWAKRATEGNVGKVPGAASDTTDLVHEYTQSQYADLLRGKKFKLTPKLRAEVAEDVSRPNASHQFPRDREDAGAALANVMGVSPRDAAGRRTITRYDSSEELHENLLLPMRAAINQLRGRSEVGADLLEGARTKLKDRVMRDTLSPDENVRLSQLDSLMFDASRGREAVKGAAGEEDGMSIARLAAAYGKNKAQGEALGNETGKELIGPLTRTLGATPNQAESRSAVVLAQRVAPLLGAGVVGAGTGAGAAAALLAAPLYALSAAGQSAKGARALLGETATQKKWVQALEGDTYARPGRSGTLAGMSTKVQRGESVPSTVSEALVEALRRINKLRAAERGAAVEYTEED
jgi:hypothetical protein